MLRISGMLFSLAGSIILMGIISAEIFYPSGYSTARSFISTLGASPPPHSISYQPAATIFDTSMLIGGILILLGSFGLKSARKKSMLVLSVACLGLGATGVGIFPASYGAIHLSFAFLTFASGGVAALLSATITSPPFRFFGMLFGCIALLFLFLGVVLPYLVVPTFGIGGSERWVAYPIILWLVIFGGYLMGSSSASNPRVSRG